MAEHNFTLILSGPVEDKLDELYEAGCDDALIGEVDGVHYAEFDREAPTRRDAILAAFRALTTVPGVRVERVEPEDLVTASEIAGRLGVSREMVRLMIAGQRGPGDFPPPVSHLRDRNRLWRWTDVAKWTDALDAEQTQDALFIAACNAALEVGRRQADLATNERKFVTNLTTLSAGADARAAAMTTRRRGRRPVRGM